ncbi:MAG: hypothetical protein ACRDH6_04940 [Actinomycetota bacterium]
MKESADVRDAMHHFYDRISARDVSAFEQVVSSDPATLVIGTAPGRVDHRSCQAQVRVRSGGLA